LRHHPLIYSVFGFSFLLAALIATILAFKSTEYADDCGLWWIPVPLFLCLDLWLADARLRGDARAHSYEARAAA
jgi:hypothetical protein